MRKPMKWIGFLIQVIPLGSDGARSGRAGPDAIISVWRDIPW